MNLYEYTLFYNKNRLKNKEQKSKWDINLADG